MSILPSIADTDIPAVLERLHALEALIASLQETVAKQEAIIRKFQAMLFGPKSEKQSASAVTPAVEDGSAVAAAPAPEMPAPSPRPRGQRGQRRGAPGHGRRLYEELPPREVLYALLAQERCCAICGKVSHPIGTEDSTTIAWEVCIRRVIHKRMKYQRLCTCGSAPVLVTAPAPPKLIPKGLLEVSAVSHLVVNKYLHGQPIHRQLQELALCCGVRFSPGTLCGVQDTVGTLLRPLYDGTLIHLRAAHHWHADETRWMHYGDEAKHRWWLWVFAAADAVLFLLDPTRARAVPRRVFGLDTEEPATGILNCDRWKSYPHLPGIQTSYCWAHVRRDFVDLAKGYPKTLSAWAEVWTQRIGRLYTLNAQRLGYTPGTNDFQLADLAVRDPVEEIARVRDAERTDTALLRDARDALESMTRHWDGLILFLDSPWVPLDNNAAERLLRTCVVGRKNFYGSGSVSSGALAECAYTVLLTAERNGLNPLTYLSAYLEACAQNGGAAPDDITRFLPWHAAKDDLLAWQRPAHIE